MARSRARRWSSAAPRALSVLVVAAIAATALVGCKIMSPPTTAQPIRAAFYYPWFPEAWAQQGQNPFTNYSPTRGFYGADVTTVRAQIADMQYGGITVGIASWFGRDTTDAHWPTLISAVQGTGFGWAPVLRAGRDLGSDCRADRRRSPLPVHEVQGSQHRLGPGVRQRQGNARVRVQRRRPHPGKGLRHGDPLDRARQLLKNQFGETIYLDLKVFPGYASCAGGSTVDGWHQYGPASAIQNFAAAPGDGSYSISPGYWKSGATYGTGPFLPATELDGSPTSRACAPQARNGS